MMERHNAAAVGMFDGVHLGHRDIMATVLNEAVRLGGSPVILTFAVHPLSVLRPAEAPRLLTTAAEKEELIRALLPSACVCMLDFNAKHGVSARDFLRSLRDCMGVGTMVMGYDNRFGCDGPRQREAYDRLGRELGMRVVHVAPRVIDGVTASSSGLRRLLVAGSVGDASAMLGRFYSVGGVVVPGAQFGRTIGFPTANLAPDAGKLLPGAGVYAAIAAVGDSGEWPAMVNIGRRPTVDRSTDAALTVEAHLIGADAYMYGRRMVLRFVRRLRDEQCFSSVEMLRRQLEADRNCVTRIFSKYGH